MCCDLHISMSRVCAEGREADRECPRVRFRPWATSSRAAASASNLTGNFFLHTSKPQSRALPPTSLSLSSPRHSASSLLLHPSLMENPETRGQIRMTSHTQSRSITAAQPIWRQLNAMRAKHVELPIMYSKCVQAVLTQNFWTCGL